MQMRGPSIAPPGLNPVKRIAGPRPLDVLQFVGVFWRSDRPPAATPRLGSRLLRKGRRRCFTPLHETPSSAWLRGPACAPQRRPREQQAGRKIPCPLFKCLARLPTQQACLPARCRCSVRGGAASSTLPPVPHPPPSPADYKARGGQGTIFNGTWQGTPVAVKALGPPSCRSAVAELKAVSSPSNRTGGVVLPFAFSLALAAHFHPAAVPPPWPAASLHSPLVQGPAGARWTIPASAGAC